MHIDTLDHNLSPLAAAEALKHEPGFCFLDSSSTDKYACWSFIAARPAFTLDFESGRAAVDGRDVGSDPFAVIDDILSEHRVEAAPNLPFACGLIGYLSYDLCRELEHVCGSAYDDLPLPGLCFGFYDCALAFDRMTGAAYICYLNSARDKARDFRRLLQGARPPEEPARDAFLPGECVDWSGVRSELTRDQYLALIAQAKDYIAAGDIYQVNLAQRFNAELQTDPWTLYKTLRAVNPAPFACYLDLPGLTLASASPERLVRLDAATGEVETRPIKGTRPRGATPEEDSCLAAELQASAKDRAENLMIVDMQRNDIGRVCEYGSVSVPELWAIEEHPSVFQMVSTVRGRLAPEHTVGDLIRAVFPGGSITGAPKVRAMQIIDELEPVRRGIYTGSVGYIDISGNMDLNICIRSIVCRDGRAWFHGGGGIVADSVPELEYQETLDKVSGLVAALTARRERRR
jgi:para-aminobenzoate synthetase component 1